MAVSDLHRSDPKETSSPNDRLRLELLHWLRGRIIIAAVGNELRADDAVGLAVADLLEKHGDFGESGPPVHVLRCGSAPENWTGKMEKLRPDCILLLDATDMGEEPGTFRLIPVDQLTGTAFSTHRLPLSKLAKYLEDRTGASAAVLGIQPARLTLGEEMSSDLRAAAEHLARILLEAIGALSTESNQEE
jgi:hydrogenase 3 maturation protease